MTTNIPGPAPLGDKLRIAFLGPFGTFTEQAVHQVAPRFNNTHTVTNTVCHMR